MCSISCPGFPYAILRLNKKLNTIPGPSTLLFQNQKLKQIFFIYFLFCQQNKLLEGRNRKHRNDKSVMSVGRMWIWWPSSGSKELLFHGVLSQKENKWTAYCARVQSPTKWSSSLPKVFWTTLDPSPLSLPRQEQVSTPPVEGCLWMQATHGADVGGLSW